jgi:hypothetical protein
MIRDLSDEFEKLRSSSHQNQIVYERCNVTNNFIIKERD